MPTNSFNPAYFAGFLNGSRRLGECTFIFQTASRRSGQGKLLSFFKEIPKEVREAAIVDGASEFNVFTQIVLPLALGGVAAAAVFTFIAAWNEFIFALVLTKTTAATAPVATLGFRTQYGIQWGATGTASLLVSRPVIIFAFIMQRYLVRGMTLGAIK